MLFLKAERLPLERPNTLPRSRYCLDDTICGTLVQAKRGRFYPQCSSTGFYAALDNRFPPCSFCFISLMLPTRRIRGALVLWLAPRVEQHLLGSIACEPTKNFFYLALPRPHSVPITRKVRDSFSKLGITLVFCPIRVRTPFKHHMTRCPAANCLILSRSSLKLETNDGIAMIGALYSEIFKNPRPIRTLFTCCQRMT